MLVSLKLPPGMYRNGTDFEAKGRWRDGSLVRWHEGILQPIGGWRERTDTAIASAARAAIAWQDNTGDRWVALGSHDALRAVSASGTISDITPVGFTSGLPDATVNTGYGGGFFGLGFYGVPIADTGNYSEATTWSLDTWGENLVGCTNADGRIYEWELDAGTPAAVVANAPTSCLSVHVTAERFMMALGAGGNPRMIEWSDREDNTTWTPAATNEAGSFQIKSDGQIMAGADVQGQTLIVTDTDAHVATYVGPPFVYGFEQVGTNCGAISRKSIVSTDRGAVWMGTRGFYGYFGGSVEPIPCDVTDYVFGSISGPQRSKVHAVHNSQFSEVWWFYPSEAATECDRYVAFSYRSGHWAFGSMDRTAGVDRGVFAQPIWTDSSGKIYDQETGINYDGADVFLESGPIVLDTGSNVFSALQLIPDEATQGDVSVSFKTRFYPNADEETHGPYVMGNPTDLRFTGRQARMRVEGAKLADWRWGEPRVRVAMGGQR